MLFDSSEEHNAILGKQINDEFLPVQLRIEYRRKVQEVFTLCFEDLNLDEIQRLDMPCDLEKPINFMLYSKPLLFMGQPLDKNLYVYCDYTDELGDFNYLPKKIVPLQANPYCCLQMGTEILVGCDFEIAILDLSTLRVVDRIKSEHRVTNL